MNNKKIFDVIGTIMLVVGFFLAFLPHAAHVAAGLGDESSHLKHVMYGVIVVAAALGMLIYNKD